MASKSFAESPIAPDPSEETLNNPSARQNSEADLIKMLIDDLNDDAGCGGNTLAGISPIGEDAVNEGEDMAGGFQKRSAAVAILDTRRMRFEHEAAPIGIDERVALSAFDLFAGVIAARQVCGREAWASLEGSYCQEQGRGVTDTPERLF